jgi:hypothetical protein
VPETSRSLQAVERKSVSKKNHLNTLKFGISALFIFIFIVGIVVSLYMNGMQQSLGNEASFITSNAINLTQHDNKKRKRFEQTATLTTALSGFKEYGLVLVANEALSTESMLNLLKQKSQQEWESFADHYDLKTVSCTWDNLAKCQQQYQGWVFVILPDFWQLAGLDSLLKSGVSILLYDGPFQVVSAYTTGSFSLYGLTFEQFSNKGSSQFVLLGDNELSFGFKSGTILNIVRRSSFYKTTSTSPQALALNAKNDVGDVLMTRLYAKAIGKGRLVWMDFIPNSERHTVELDKHHVESVVASLFKYLKNTDELTVPVKISKK